MHPLQLGVMLPLKEKDKPIIQKLLAASCCARCVLRFCCVSVHAAYRQPQQVRPFCSRSDTFPESVTHPTVLHHKQETLRELQDFIRGTEDTVSQDGDNKSHDAAASESSEDPPSKRAKLEPAGGSEAEGDGADVVKQDDGESCVCAVCLGVLQELSDASQAMKVRVCVCVCVVITIDSFIQRSQWR